MNKKDHSSRSCKVGISKLQCELCLCKSSFIETQTCPFVYAFSVAAFRYNCRAEWVETGTIWLTKTNIFIVWLFIENAPDLWHSLDHISHGKDIGFDSKKSKESWEGFNRRKIGSDLRFERISIAIVRTDFREARVGPEKPVWMVFSRYTRVPPGYHHKSIRV